MQIMNWKEFLLPYEQMIDELSVKFENIAKELSLDGQHSPIELVQSRVKRIASILDKANKKNIELNEIEEKIDDIGGIRIICRFVEDIDKVVCLIREREGFDLNVVKEQDYVNNKKQSGYRSYHIIIKYTILTGKGKKELLCEIQIRTLAMNFWATIEHSLKYKYKGNIPEELKKRLRSSAEVAFLLDKEMGLIRNEIVEVQKEIKVKNELVDQTMKKLQDLSSVAKLENVNELNNRFFSLYAEGDLHKLQEFYKQLKIMAKIYQL